MLNATIALLVVALIIAGILLYPTLVWWHRQRLKHQPFPPMWAALVENTLPFFNRLSPEQQQRLQGHIQVFLAEKQFIGCGGLGVTDEMKVVIATIACLLLLNEQGHYFPKLRSILIYPRAYLVKETTAIGPYVVEEQQVARLGESWQRDQLVLAWEQVQWDIAHWQDGHNVILHEFAHQLDQADGQAEGVPILPQRADYTAWTEVMTLTYHQLCRDVDLGHKTVLDPYGATNPAEFFAVATETFFEKPQPLLRYHPALYQQLQRYYQLNPRELIG